MAKILINQVDTYRVDGEEEAIDLINDYKARQEEDHFMVKDSGYKQKVKKVKGEIVDVSYIVKIAVSFDD